MDLALNGKHYVTMGRLSAFDQLHVARRLAPALPLVQGLVDPKNAEKSKTLLIVLMLAHISEEDSDYVVQKCLSVVGVVQGKKTAPLYMSDGTLMFADTSMPDMLELTMAVIEENTGDFFRTALGTLEAQAAALPG